MYSCYIRPVCQWEWIMAPNAAVQSDLFGKVLLRNILRSVSFCHLVSVSAKCAHNFGIFSSLSSSTS